MSVKERPPAEVVNESVAVDDREKETRGAAGVVHCGEKQRGIGQARTRQFKNTIQGGRP